MKAKIKNKAQSFIIISLLQLIVLFISCNSTTHLMGNKNQKIIVCAQCESEESSSDILHSVNEISAQLEKKNIIVEIDNKRKLCGYLFEDGNKSKEITGAITDIELLKEVNEFFK